MHEASIAQGIIDTAVAALPNKQAKIRKIIVVAGVFSGVSGDCLDLYLQELSKGTPAHGAALEVRHAPAELICQTCGVSQSYSNEGDLEPRCSRCGGARKVQGGNELYIESLEVDE
jgi:hydrogenase nickel incorporation protein HypA/HybF